MRIRSSRGRGSWPAGTGSASLSGRCASAATGSPRAGTSRCRSRPTTSRASSRERLGTFAPGCSHPRDARIKPGEACRRRCRRRTGGWSQLMNVAVLGAGGGGLAVAYEWASHGHRVTLYAQHAHDHHLAPVRERGGIQAEGVLEGFARLERVTSDIAEALEGAEVV